MLTWLEISKNNLVHNLKQFRRIVGNGVKIMAVIKSNAYGHGMIECAKIFEKAGADYLGVINLDEALLLKGMGIKKPIFILSFWDFDVNKVKKAILSKSIEFPVYTEQQIKFLSKISQKIGKKAKIHIKIDTGTSRIGILPKTAPNFIKKCLKSTHLDVRGVFTHFAKAEAKNQLFTTKQVKKLAKIKENLGKLAKNIIFYAGCTASTINNPKTHFNMVRIGLGLYGLWPSPDIGKFYRNRTSIELNPVMRWKTKIIQVKELPKGTFIGYDCTYRCKRKTKIAVLPIGYWDGYDRKLSNLGEVLICGKKVSVLGRICMNLTMIDVSKVKNVKVGDEVILLGNKITADELAEKVKTINYEIVTRINQIIKRIYK